MKKLFLHDLLRLTLFHICFGILMVIFDSYWPGLLIVLVFYFVSVLFLFYSDYRIIKKQQDFERLLAKYETHLSQTSWTQVFLKSSTTEKIGIFMNLGNFDELFYAKLDVNRDTSAWCLPKLFILIAYVDNEKQFSEDMEYNLRWSPETFEEYFGYEESQAD